jgi:hypothetical protein
VQVALLYRLAANVAALDCMMGPVGSPGAAADAASAATADDDRQHHKLLEEVYCGNADQVNLLLWQTARQLAQGFRLRGVAPLSGTPAPVPVITAAGRAPSTVVPPVPCPDNASNNNDSDYEANSDDDDNNEESGDNSGIKDDEV